MRAFQLDSGMKTMRGVFYPTDWMVLMFPGEKEARDAARILGDQGIAEDDLMLLTPEDFRRDIVGATGDDDMLPSVGTEGDTVRRFAQLAREGHHGLMVHAGDHKQAVRVVEMLRDVPISSGQLYRKLVIEDIVDPQAAR